MSPRQLDIDIIHVRLRKIRELLKDLASYGAVSTARMQDDSLLRHGVERILTAVVDLAVSAGSHVLVAVKHEAPLTYAECFLALAEIGALDGALAEELAASARMRNVLVHQYLDIDFALVAVAAGRATEAYRAFSAQLLRFAESHEA